MFEKLRSIDPEIWIKKKLLGRLMDEVWAEAYAKGREDAKRNLRHSIRRRYETKGLEHFASKELQIGYSYAKGLIEEVLDGRI